MKKIDRRKNYGILLDTETAGTLEEPLFYEIGWNVIDSKGNIYESREYINKDVFYGMYELMYTCYYHDKLPEYIDRIRKHEIEVRTTYEIMKIFREDCKKYRVKFACAHNMRFDYKALKNTRSVTTDGKYKYFLPYGLELWDTMRMSEGAIVKRKSYRQFCLDNDYLTSNNQSRKTAEILYRYISGNNDFVESHTALDDVQIETEIFKYCMRQHKKMRKNAFSNKKTIDRAVKL